MTDARRYGTCALWTAVTAIGYSLGLYAGLFLAHLALGPLMAAFSIGAGIGLAQRPVLQSWLEPRRSRAWSPADSAGWILGSVAGMVFVVAVVWTAVDRMGIEGDTVGWLGLVGTFALGGSLAGLIQKRVLRRYALASDRWIAASALGWGASALGIGLAPVLAEQMFDLFVVLLAPAIGGLVMGLVTGCVLVRLPLRQHAPAPPGASPSGRSG